YFFTEKRNENILQNGIIQSNQLDCSEHLKISVITSPVNSKYKACLNPEWLPVSTNTGAQSRQPVQMFVDNNILVSPFFSNESKIFFWRIINDVFRISS